MNRKVRLTLTPDWDKVGLGKHKSHFKNFVLPGPSNATLVSTASSLQSTESLKDFEYFVTGSKYKGNWDALGFSGLGKYYFTHGAIYEGYFKDGEFHGEGTISYPVGVKLRGEWKNGKLIEKEFHFSDGLKVTDPWGYCEMPDRRFQIECNLGLKGPGEELLANKQRAEEIPRGCYDTADGYFSPELNCIFDYTDEMSTTGFKKYNMDLFRRTVGVKEGQLIQKRGRAAEIKWVGYCPELYKFWMTGTRAQVEKLRSLLIAQRNLKKSRETELRIEIQNKELRGDLETKNVSFMGMEKSNV